MVSAEIAYHGLALNRYKVSLALNRYKVSGEIVYHDFEGILNE